MHQEVGHNHLVAEMSSQTKRDSENNCVVPEFILIFDEGFNKYKREKTTVIAPHSVRLRVLNTDRKF